MDKIYDEKITIKVNIKLNTSYFLLSFDSPRFASLVKPGQFLNLKLNSSDCLLRRPFSVYDIRGDEILILYMVVGRGTEIMANLQAGETLEALGPLGHGFTIPSPEKKVYLLSGGTGIGSVYLLYSHLKSKNHPNLIFATGFRNSDYFFDELEDKNVVVFTEDGSKGRKGFVTEILEEVLDKPEKKVVYACGPHGMLQAVHERLENVPCFAEISLEETMACGLGACLGCVAETKEGRKTVCQGGPVFRLDEVAF